MEKSKRPSIFWLFTIGLMIVGLALIAATVRWHFYGHEILRELTRAIAEAFFVAGFIAFAVDQFVKDRFLREIVRDVFKYLVGYNLPPEIQDRIKDLMGTAVIRRDYQHTYTFGESDGRIKLTVRGQYRVENCSNSEQPYTPRLDMERDEEPVLIEFRCDSDDENAIDRITGVPAQFDKDKSIVNFSLKNLKVQPVKSGLTYTISYKFYRFVKRADKDLMAFHAPTIGVTIVAECPENLVFDGGRDATIKTANRWEYKSLFTQGQHLHPRWFPKEISK